LFGSLVEINEMVEGINISFYSHLSIPPTNERNTNSFNEIEVEY
jgi:hypothetical protein